MPRAVWNGMVIAESDQTIRVEGNDYIPPNSVRRQSPPGVGIRSRLFSG